MSPQLKKFGIVLSPTLLHHLHTSVVFSRGPEENARLAEEVFMRLTAHKADNPSMGEVRSYLQLYPGQFFSRLLCRFRSFIIDFSVLRDTVSQIIAVSGFRFLLIYFFSRFAGPLPFALLLPLLCLS